MRAGVVGRGSAVKDEGESDVRNYWHVKRTCGGDVDGELIVIETGGGGGSSVNND